MGSSEADDEEDADVAFTADADGRGCRTGIDVAKRREQEGCGGPRREDDSALSADVGVRRVDGEDEELRGEMMCFAAGRRDFEARSTISAEGREEGEEMEMEEMKEEKSPGSSRDGGELRLGQSALPQPLALGRDQSH